MLVRMENLDLPLAFTWGSDTPVAGRGFDEWVSPLLKADTTDAFVLWHGYYYRDEAQDSAGQMALGRMRVEHVRSYLKMDPAKSIVELLPQEITADVRSVPFTAVSYEIVEGQDVLHFSGDTAQLCFPIADSLLLPSSCLEDFDRWVRDQLQAKKDIVYIIGTADGTGVAESADVAMDRANWIQKRIIALGWKAERIRLSSGQRNTPHTLLNRCVLVYVDPVQ